MSKKGNYRHELIGQEIKIIKSQNQSNENIEGKIVDETKNTLKIMNQGKIKTFMKNNITFTLKKNDLLIEGKKINKRTEERIK